MSDVSTLVPTDVITTIRVKYEAESKGEFLFPLVIQLSLSRAGPSVSEYFVTIQ